MTDYGLQLYSVRDVAKPDLKEALRRVSEMGYRFVEFAGFFENLAKDVKAWLDEFGLTVSGTHTGLSALAPDRIEETIAYHKAIGCTDLIVPLAKWGTEELMDANIKLMNEAQKRLAEEGIRLGYHNHSSEFYTTPYGKKIEDELINRTDVCLEIDTFWVFNAGLDPVAYCESMKHRIRMIHLKDGIIPKDRVRDFATAHEDVKGVSLGLGDAPIRAVRDWAIKNQVRMIVESEGLDPTGLEEVQRCMNYLRSLEA